jgi:hypothetical protein
MSGTIFETDPKLTYWTAYSKPLAAQKIQGMGHWVKSLNLANF